MITIWPESPDVGATASNGIYTAATSKLVYIFKTLVIGKFYTNGVFFCTAFF